MRRCSMATEFWMVWFTIYGIIHSITKHRRGKH